MHKDRHLALRVARLWRGRRADIYSPAPSYLVEQDPQAWQRASPDHDGLYDVDRADGLPTYRPDVNDNDVVTIGGPFSLGAPHVAPDAVRR